MGGFLHCIADQYTVDPYCGAEWAAGELGVSVSTVERGLESLRGHGYIVQTKRGGSKSGNASDFLLTFPSIAPATGDDDVPVKTEGNANGVPVNIAGNVDVPVRTEGNVPVNSAEECPSILTDHLPMQSPNRNSQSEEHSSARFAGADQREGISEGWTPNKAHAAKCPRGLSVGEVGEKFRELAIERKLTSADWDKKFGGFLGYLDGVVERYASRELTGPIVWADHLEDYLFGGAEQFTPKGLRIECPF
ncbi:Uncharacterised protein (plasmid) [Tsukamurella tyrosinosolvens]|uniref:Helix-turn-helix domain-containing protein n=1 Tax=Tsukamurella tyrosinosolvens TaxID=57704 RepID=A0A1H4QPT5_TSUTY|nr:hypothetical protein [Tsukamurella tyrosinosolvens]SEC21669.1 hypothetical protein SAMN04489793_1814 [Tsukamurella tyrosinosolvens]VEH92522.1 Uncharacterised protein [Tsukamurella tyrosinosolvens]